MKTNPSSFEQIWQAVQNGQNFFVAGHLNPDGDSLGCTLAVCSLLERLGKTAYAYASPAIGTDLLFLPLICSDLERVFWKLSNFTTVILRGVKWE